MIFTLLFAIGTPVEKIDLQMLPNRQIVTEYRKFAQVHFHQYVMKNPEGWGEAHIRKCEYLFEIWDILDDAQLHRHNIRACKVNLWLLRLYLGEVNYYQGKMPYPVPLEDFKEGIPPK